MMERGFRVAVAATEVFSQRDNDCGPMSHASRCTILEAAA
jgi:hypothetical protein